MIDDFHMSPSKQNHCRTLHLGARKASRAHSSASRSRMALTESPRFGDADRTRWPDLGSAGLLEVEKEDVSPEVSKTSSER